jgi:hypothetical protein
MKKSFDIVHGFIILSLMTIWLCPPGFAQSENKEMRTLKLQIKEARLSLIESQDNLQKTESAFKEAQTLFEKGLYTKKELAAAEEDFRNAQLRKDQTEINLEKTRLAFLNNALYVSLEKASLYRDAHGEKHALLRLRNNSNLRKVIDDENTYSDADKKGLLSIENLSIRVLKDDKLIGSPFEYKIPQFDYGQTRDVDFTLQRETDAVTVEIAYGDTIIHLPVYLEKDAAEDRVVIQASQFSQEGELGKEVSYELNLERFVDDSKTFSLDAVGLPADYSLAFYEVDSMTGRPTRVSSLRFKKGSTVKTIQLVISMPTELDKEKLDHKIIFYVLAPDQFQQQRLNSFKNKTAGREATPAELDSTGLAYETLELVPRGKAEITISANNFFRKNKMGDQISFPIDLTNSGTVDMTRIRMKLILPMEWTANIKPEKDISLAIQEKKTIEIEAIPAVDVVPGDYEIKIDAETQHQGRRIQAAQKVMRIQLEGKSNILMGIILIIVLIGVVGGVAVMTIKISRR